MKLCCIFLYFVICIQGVDNYSFVFSLGKWGVLKQGPLSWLSLDVWGLCTRQVLFNKLYLYIYIKTTSWTGRLFLSETFSFEVNKTGSIFKWIYKFWWLDMSSLSVVSCECFLGLRSGQTKDYKVYIWYFSSAHRIKEWEQSLAVSEYCFSLN